MRRFLALLLGLALVWSCAAAETPPEGMLIPLDPDTLVPLEPISEVEETAWPEPPDGFLAEGEYVWEDEEAGLWQYNSPTLWVEVRRYQQTGPRLVWFEAEVYARPGETWYMAPAEEGKHVAISHWPYEVAQRNGVVLGINNDYVGGRWGNKDKSIGIIIRDGNILWSRTRKAGNRYFPNCDTLALMPDGTLAVHNSDELTAEEYLEMGAENVLSFGPWLIRDGVLNTEAFPLHAASTYNNPRTAIGMVENGHYWAVMVEGRNKQRSVGVSVEYVANLLLDKGCTVGFNLDGGETASICFMGKQLNQAGGAKNAGLKARRISDMLAIGYSEQVKK